VCVVASGIQDAMHMRHVVIYGLSDCSLFLHITSYSERISRGGGLCFDFLCNFCPKRVSF